MTTLTTRSACCSRSSTEDPTAANGTVDNTTSDVTAVVDRVRESVSNALTADSPTGTTATDGTAVAGTVGLTGTVGVVGLLFALVRHRRR